MTNQPLYDVLRFMSPDEFAADVARRWFELHCGSQPSNEFR